MQHRIHYIIRLPVSEVHILAKRNIRSIEDLRGKKVNFGPAGSASSLTGSIIFQRAGIKVEQTLFDNPLALQKLRSGEIDALIRMIGKPIDFFAKIPANDDFHLVPIPFSKNFSDYYALSEFTKAEYPTLISEGDTTTTLGVPAVLAVYNWPRRAIAPAGCSGWSSGCSPTGRNSSRRRAIRSGTKSILPRRCRAGRAGRRPRRCCRRCGSAAGAGPQCRDRGRPQAASRLRQAIKRRSASGCTGNSSSGKRTRSAKLAVANARSEPPVPNASAFMVSATTRSAAMSRMH